MFYLTDGLIIRSCQEPQLSLIILTDIILANRNVLVKLPKIVNIRRLRNMRTQFKFWSTETFSALGKNLMYDCLGLKQ